MTRQTETLIIGGGISGLACARALFQGGRDFLLLTDRLGGRMFTAEDGLPFGAAYGTIDYQHVLPLATKLQRNPLRNVYFWDGRRMITLLDPRNLRRGPAIARIYRLLIPFRWHVKHMREQAPHVCQKTLMERDPVLRRYVEQPATEFIAEHGLEDLAELACGPLAHTTLFLPLEQINAFYCLAVLFPGLVPAFTLDLRPAVPRLTAGWQDRIVMARATSVNETGGGERFEVHAGDEAYRARNLVLAVPAHNEQSLLAVPSTTRAVPYCTLHVSGRRRRQYRPGKTVFLRPEHPIRVLWPQVGGTDIIFAPTTEPDLSEYYERHEITGSVAWKTANQVSGSQWRPLRPRENLFTIGDHNILGLEDSYLTGLFAANRILETTQGS